MRYNSTLTAWFRSETRSGENYIKLRKLWTNSEWRGTNLGRADGTSSPLAKMSRLILNPQ